MFDRPVTPLARLEFFECLAALFLDAHRPARTLSFRILPHFAQIKANQQALISDMSPIKRRSGNGRDLIKVGAAMICFAFRESRLLVNVHYLQIVATFEVLLTNLSDVQNGARGARRRPGDIKPEKVASLFAARSGIDGLFGIRHLAFFRRLTGLFWLSRNHDAGSGST